MAPSEKQPAELTGALEVVVDFVRQVTGIEPTPAEIADALGRYFVLNEIKDHIVMMREDGEDQG